MKTKRMDYIDWDTMFMGMAAIASMRSKDPDTQNGALIVEPDTKIVKAVGYNGLPPLCSDDTFPWDRDSKDPYDSKYSYVIHAEANAFNNRYGSVRGCHLYLYSSKGYPPCAICAQTIAANRISEVIMAAQIKTNTDVYNWKPTMRIFQNAGIKLRIIERSSFCFTTLSHEFQTCSRKVDEVNYPETKNETEACK